MHNEVTGSMRIECDKRLDTFFRTCNTWCLQVAYNITKSKEESEDLVQELMIYLHEKCNPKIFFGDSYNKMYAMAFLKHRWLNKTTKLNRTKYIGFIENDEPLQEYDTQKDLDVMKAYDDVRNELQNIKKTKHFASAMIYEDYWYSDKTLNEVADSIGISKSTTFIHIRKMRSHMRDLLDNPFHD